MFEDTIMAAPGSLTGAESLDNLENWDSMAVVVFMAQVDENFSISLSGAEIAHCRTVNDLLELLRSAIHA